MEKNNKLNRRKIFVSLGLAAVIGAGGVGAYHYQKTAKEESERLEQAKEQKRQELKEAEGTYNNTSIVLSDTSKVQAESIAEKIGAKVRLTEKEDYAVLYLPDDVTIEDVYDSEEYGEYLPEMDPDYYVSVCDAEDESRKLYTSHPEYTVNDEYYGMQSYLDYVHMGDTWTASKGAGVKVAVIDSGIDTDNAEFKGRISVDSYNASTDKKVKDYGMDVIEDEDGHGTGVTGVLAASMDQTGITGIAPESDIIVIKCETDGNGQFTRSSDLVFGLAYAIECDADVVNMSFGTDLNIFSRYTKLAVDSDIICVASAGNDSTAMPSYPAADENVIGVGALESGGWGLADYSNYGDNSDVLAPGTAYTTQKGGSYAVSNGTSIAAPVVSGAVALYLSGNPNTEFSTMKELLQASSADLGVLGEDWQHGFGALDIHALVREEKGTITYEMLTDEIDNMKQIFVKGHTVQTMAEPERENLVLDGWFYDNQATDECEYYTDLFTEDVTLYAGWINEDDGTAWQYTVQPDNTVEITAYTGKRRYLTVPKELEGKTVSSIGEGAFSENSRIRQVSLPASINLIRDRAFYSCNSLREIEIPEKVVRIGSEAFYGCTRLSQVSIVSNGALKEIGTQAFAMSGINSISLPANLTDLASDAFYASTNLRKISVADGNRTFRVIKDALYSADGDTLLYYPAGKGGIYEVADQTITIGDNAFAYSKCREVVFPESLEVFGNRSFYSSYIISANIPAKVEQFGSDMFCSSRLAEVSFAPELKAEILADNMFGSCWNLKEVTIPKNIDALGDLTFAFSGLQKISFADGSRVSALGRNSFTGCPIEEFHVPDGITAIAYGTFNFCQNLKILEFGKNSNCTMIDDYAFENCLNLEKIELPSRMSSIGRCVFWNSGLKEIRIGKGIKSIAEGAFSHCQKLNAITVENTNECYAAESGILFNKDKTELICYPAAKTGSYQLPDSVKKIGNRAFAGVSELKQIILNSGLEEIGGYAFSECTSLAELNFNSELKTIGENAFEYCTSFDSEIVIPKKVISVGRFAFYMDYNLNKITIESDSSLSRIGYGAFGYCGIEDFTIPENVSSMGQEIFVGCTNLIAVTFEADSQLENLAAWTFNGADELRQITFEEESHLKNIEARSLEGLGKLQRVTLENCKNLKKIGNYAFRNNTSLSEISFPASLTEIGRYAFDGCVSLVRLDMPENLDRIGRYAFFKDKSLNIYFMASELPKNLEENWDYDIQNYFLGINEVKRSGDWEYALGSDGMANIIAYYGSDTDIILDKVDGHKVASIGSEVFKDNITLNTIKLPETLTGIYQRAFAGTTALKNLTVPASVKIIDTEAFKDSGISEISFANGSQLETLGSYVFAQTPNLNKVAVPEGVSKIRDYSFYKSNVKAVSFDRNSNLSEIGRYAFSKANILDIKIPAGVKRLDYYAFADAAQLEKVEMNGVSDLQIMGNAFYGSGLEKIYLPEGVTYLGEFCFTDCKNLMDISVADGNSTYASSDGVLFNKAQTKLITCPSGKNGSYTVPDTVLSFMSGAFEGCSLREIHMSENCKLQTLGYRTFYDCDSLEEIDIPDSILSIDNYAFAYCDNLKKVNISENSQLSGIYKGAFYKDEKLVSLAVPSGAQEIGDYAFYGCAAMDTIQLNSNSILKRVSDHAFEYAGITKFTMPEKLDEVGSYAFNGAKLRSIAFNDVVTSIGDFAFADCGLADMTVMTMPESIEYLGTSALKGADTIEEITVPFVGTVEDDTVHTKFVDLFGGVANNLRIVKILKGRVLGFEAFGNYHNLEGLISVILPENLIEIGQSAFSQTTLTELKIPESVKFIGRDAFSLSRIENINLPNGLEEIDDHVFYSSYIKKIEIPDSVKNIGEKAFYGCFQLNYISLSKQLKKIGKNAFSACTSLRKIYIDEANPNYKSVDGILYDKSCKTIIAVPCGISGLLKIPEGIEEIPDEMFSKCVNITEIQFPYSLNKIGHQAFAECDNIRSIVIPENIKEIGEEIFWCCRNLRSVEIKAKLRNLKNMFASCPMLKEIIYPNTIEDLGSLYGAGLESITIENWVSSVGTMEGCFNLKSIYLGDKVKLQGNISFADCNSLTDIRVSEKNPYYTVVDGCLYTKDKKTLLAVPRNKQGNMIVEDGVETIGAGSVSCCNKLTKVVLPESVANIEEKAFYLSNNLTEFVFGHNIKKIGESAIEHTGYYDDLSKWSDGLLYVGEYLLACKESVEECVIKDGTRLIGEKAFGFSSISRVKFPDSVQYINKCAFVDCKNLKALRLNNNLKEISNGAFSIDGNIWSLFVSEETRTGDFFPIQINNVKYASVGRNVLEGLLRTASIMECIRTPSRHDFSMIQGYGQIKNFVLTDVKELTKLSFNGISGSTIFVNVSKDTDLPQGWNNGNKVYYKGQWHYAEFDSDGMIIQMNPTLNGEVLQVPATSVVENLLPEGAEFAGWDINGDGLVDKLPAILTEDIHAEAVYNVDIKGISLGEETTVEKGYTKKLEVKYSPAHYTVEGGVTFTSFDDSVVTVDKDGTIKGIKEGTATITATLNSKPSVTASCTVEVVTPDYGIRFEPNYGNINVGETLQLEPDLKLPEQDEFTPDPEISWKSEDETIATVDDGLLTGIAPGTVTITASCGEYSAEFYLTVLAPLESISLDQTEGNLNVGDTQQLKVNYLPENTTDDRAVTWFSTRSAVATVDENGLVTAVGAGTAKIKASVGGKITTYEVTVKAPLKWIKLNTTTGTMRLGRSKQLEIIYEPFNTTDDKTAVWTSSNPDVAYVDENGLVTAVSRGKAKITASVGSLNASYDVTVIGIRDYKTGIIVSNSDNTEMDESLGLGIEDIQKNNSKLFEEILRKISETLGAERAEMYGFTAYDISLLQGDQTVQPTTSVNVDIPVSVQGEAVVYRVESDGSLTDMHVTTADGYYSFETEHFSTYVLGIRHNWSTTPLEEKKPTCTEDGWITYKCQDCDEIKKEEIPAVGHQKKEIDEIPATCTEAGKSAGTECIVCGLVLSGEEELPALGHDYGDWILVKEATYAEEGIEEQICRRDSSHKQMRNIPKLKVPLSSCKLELSDSIYMYDGVEKKPEVTVVYNGVTLTEGIDYILRYTDNINPGTAAVTIEAIETSNCTGSVQKKFVIRPALEDNAVVVLPNAFEGCANLVNVNIRATVTEIGNQAFADCKNLRNIYFFGNCPKLGKDIFKNVKAAAYYPYNDATWTLDKLQNYGGTITWRPWNPETGKPAKRDLSRCELSVNAGTLLYDGKAKTPQVTVKDSGQVIQRNKDYTVSYQNNVNPGTGIVTVRGKGVYEGTLTARFNIGKGNNVVKVSDITKNVSGKTQKAKVNARVYGGARLTYASNSKSVKVDKNGNVTIAKNFVGRAVITVKASETAYYKAASKQFSVTVKPSATSISKATNTAKKKITVIWKKNKTCSGYAIQYSLNKNFRSGVKTIYIGKNSMTKKTLSGLVKGKTYYVRLASYKKAGSTKILSNWSKAKAVKIRK